MVWFLPSRHGRKETQFVTVFEEIPGCRLDGLIIMNCHYAAAELQSLRALGKDHSKAIRSSVEENWDNFIHGRAVLYIEDDPV
jgi:hypothetical protein